MDFSKFKTNDWLLVGGGLGALIFGFVSWADGGGNAFDFFFTGTVPWLLLVATGVLAFLKVQGTLGGNLPWPLIFVGTTGLAVLLLLIRLIFNPYFKAGIDFDIGRGPGMILSVISGIAALAGAVLGFQAAGGDLKDLTDVNKLKGAFGGDDTPPPPPSA